MTQNTPHFHTCQAIVISCMDFRLRKYILKWSKVTFEDEGYDRVAIAGGVKNLSFVLEQIEFCQLNFII